MARTARSSNSSIEALFSPGLTCPSCPQFAKGTRVVPDVRGNWQEILARAKRLCLLASAGVLVAAIVTPADVTDRAAFPTLLRKARRVAPTISHLWVDKGYTGRAVISAAAGAGVTVEVISGPKPGRGFIVQPRRWVVERTNGWINHCRRIDRHYETTLAAHEGFLYLSQIALLLRRLDRSQLFDTL
ncbi:hypothetical protein BMW24_002845 [Mycobacterium heckeshornense]|nr:hypothetical protein BMW24_002845 [Mycobacterium heckeshornense]